MFGYIRPFIPYLRMCEYEVYRAVYCGVCKAIGRKYGQIPRLTLSYDLAFLALCDMSLNNEQLVCKSQRCIAHPFVKRTCGLDNEALKRCADINTILVYHKLRDDISDGDLKERLKAKAALCFFENAYKKASVKYKDLSDHVEYQLEIQSRLEKEKCSSVDMASSPTAEILKSVFSIFSDDPEKKTKLGRFGYFLGRYIYLTDALDDIIKDSVNGSYNPLLCGLTGKLTKKEYKTIASKTEVSIRLTLGSLAESYTSLDFGLYKTIIDNIIYLGLNDTFIQVKERTFNKHRKRKDDSK